MQNFVIQEMSTFSLHLTFSFHVKLLQVVERLCNLKPIELKDDGLAEFELEMSLKDPTSKIFIYKVRYSILQCTFFQE